MGGSRARGQSRVRMHFHALPGAAQYSPGQRSGQAAPQWLHGSGPHPARADAADADVWQKAAWLYLRAAEVSPANCLPLVYLFQAYNAMGRKEDETRARRRAIELIERALCVNPNDARARYMGAASFTAPGEKAKAISRPESPWAGLLFWNRVEPRRAEER
jgi:hypothetical protein